MSELEQEIEKYITWCKENNRKPSDGYALIDYTNTLNGSK